MSTSKPRIRFGPAFIPSRESPDAEPVVFHPGFLLGRERDEAIATVVDQLGELRERLEPKGRTVPFGLEIMGRVRRGAGRPIPDPLLGRELREPEREGPPPLRPRHATSRASG
jgi:hypothetical protein